MNKSIRRNLIRNRWLGLAGVAISGLMPVSSVEIAKEAHNVRRHEVSDSILDEEIEGVQSGLAFDSVNVKTDKDSEILLNKKEKRRLNREVDVLHWNEGKNRNNWLAIV